MLWSAQTQHVQCHPKYCRKHRTTLKFHGLCLIIHILIADIKVNVDERSQLKGSSSEKRPHIETVSCYLTVLNSILVVILQALG